MIIGIKNVGKDLEFIDVNVKYRCELKPYIFNGNNNDYDLIQHVSLTSDGLQLVVDEEGLLKDSKLNLYLYDSKMTEVYPIVGDAIFIRVKPINPWIEECWDYEIEDLTDNDVCIIYDILNMSNFISDKII